MTASDGSFSIRNLYLLTGAFGLVGFVCYFWSQGVLSAAAFALGVLASLGNLWLFEWLSGSIAPNASSRKPWQAGAYLARYAILLAIGYAIVKALNVSPLAVVLGLLTNAAAVLASLILELISHALYGKASH
jgi:ATP synthase I subunit